MILGQQRLPLISTRDFEQNAAWLRQLLVQHEVKLSPSSATARCLDDMEYLSTQWKGSPRRRRPVINYFFYARTFGLDYYIRALRRTLVHNPALNVANHLRAFRGPNIGLMANAKRSEARDRAWELLVGCLVGSFADDTTLTEGSGPDVVCQYGGLSFGVECKVLYSSRPGTLEDAIVDGVKQLEESNVDYGVVATYASNAIQPGGLQTFPLRPFSSPLEAMARLERELERAARGMNISRLVQRASKDRKGKPRLKTRKVLFVAQAVVEVESTPTSLTSVSVLDFRRLSVPACDSFVMALRRSTQLA